MSYKKFKEKQQKDQIDWTEKCFNVGKQWQDLYNKSAMMWFKQSNFLIEKAIYDTTIERDRQWKLQIHSVKNIKSKLPSN